jgi:hypothetical protein
MKGVRRCLVKSALGVRAVPRLCLLLVGLALVPACAAETDLVGSGRVNLDLERSRLTRVHSARIYEEGGDTVISGTIRRTRATVGELLGHVDVRITGPDGSLIERLHIEPRRPRDDDPEFRLELPIRLPPGSTVSLRYTEQYGGSG